MAEEGALSVVPQEFGLAVARDPNAVLAEAHRAAKALKDVVANKEKPVMMNGEQYLEFEDWQTVGKFYNVTAKVVDTKYVEIGGARGYEARAVAFHGPTGLDVSAAEAMCLNDEDKWSTRSKYEYQDGKRVKVGDVAVPLFQLRSMAQTRACAKALRNCLAWVVVLAGYRPNVAEEMVDGDPESPQVSEPKAKPAEAAPAGDVISVPQAKRLYAIWKSGGNKDDEPLKAYLENNYGVSSSKDIKRSDYEAICDWASKQKA